MTPGWPWIIYHFRQLILYDALWRQTTHTNKFFSAQTPFIRAQRIKFEIIKISNKKIKVCKVFADASIDCLVAYAKQNSGIFNRNVRYWMILESLTNLRFQWWGANVIAPIIIIQLTFVVGKKYISNYITPNNIVFFCEKVFLRRWWRDATPSLWNEGIDMAQNYGLSLYLLQSVNFWMMVCSLHGLNARWIKTEKLE